MKTLLLGFILILSGNYFAQNEIHQCAAAKISSAGNSAALSKINYPGDNSIDIKYYKLDIQLFPSENRISGTTTIDLTSETDNLIQFYLDFNQGMNVSEVRLNSENATYSHSEGKIIIQLKFQNQQINSVLNFV